MTKKLLFAATLSALLGSACEPPATQPPPEAPTQGSGSAGTCPSAECGPLAEIARVCNVGRESASAAPSDDQSIGATQCNRGADGVCRWEHVCPGDKPTGGSQGGPGAHHPAPAPPPATGPAQTAPAPQQGGLPAGFTEANTAFAQDLYGRLGAAQGNFFFSPASISTALAMTYPGARGETAAQMAKTLRFTLPPDQLHPAFAGLLSRIQDTAAGGPEIRIANRLWGQAGMPIEADFLKVTKDHYGAAMELVDFKKAAEPARAQINKWASDQTNGKITDILPSGSINPLTRLVLANAIYFKGTWATQFDKAATKSEPFTVKPGTTATVPMMHKTLSARFGEAADASVLELTYKEQRKDRALSMVVILPKAVDGLPKVEESLAAGKLGGYLGVLGNAQVDVSLPRFKMTSEHNLSQTLAAMGMPIAFDDQKADFSGISKAERLYITRVQHKAFVEVNEEGTEAAAVTAVVVGTKSLPPPPKVFRADHPFAFLIRDASTGTVLFMGRLAKPG